MGATPALSWLGVLGYSGASALPAWIISWLGPKVREMSTEAFSTTDFGRKRYGRVMQLCIALLSCFYMFIFIVAEMTALSGIFAELTQNFSTKFGVSVTVSLGAFTVFYTSLAGLPSSIVTDRFQGIIMIFLVLLLTVAVPANEENHITKSEFDLASNWTTEGLMAAVTLVLAIASAEMFNQGNWQRVWAAEDIPTMRKGMAIGSVLVFFLMVFFGVMGMIAYANNPEAYDSGEKYAYLSFFDLLLPLKEGWHIITLILVTALAASSIDTLQNGLSSVFSRDLVKFGWHPKWFTRCLMIAMNVPAVIMASKQYGVIELFLIADLVCATSVFPVYCGLQTKDKGYLKAPTELGALLGCVSGVFAVVINGIINDADGGIFEYFWLRNGGICALCGSKTMVSFIITPVASLVMTYVFSYLDVMVRGERARQPLISIAFDDDETKDVHFDEPNYKGDDEELDSENGTTSASAKQVANGTDDNEVEEAREEDS
jgi:Na+/proline symporter